MWFINIMYWLQAFAAPVMLFGFIGVITGSLKLFILLIIIGAVVGVFLVEYIRRKIGLDTFFGRLYGSNEMDEKFKKKKQ
jgi:hypothetical protein